MSASTVAEFHINKTDLQSLCALRDSRSESELGAPLGVCPCNLYIEPETQKQLCPVNLKHSQIVVTDMNSLINIKVCFTHHTQGC
jgi:hypothetical protein